MDKPIALSAAYIGRVLYALVYETGHHKRDPETGKLATEVEFVADNFFNSEANAWIWFSTSGRLPENYTGLRVVTVIGMDRFRVSEIIK